MSKKSSKQSARPLDDGYDAIAASSSGAQSSEQTAGFFIAGFFIAFLPAYLFHSVYDVTFADNAIVYLLVTLAAAAMLTLGYRNVELGQRQFLASSRKGGRYAAAKSQADTDNFISQEALCWSLFLNNAVFAAVFLFFAFYALKNIEALYSYILSVLLASAITWQLSNGSVRA